MGGYSLDLTCTPASANSPPHTPSNPSPADGARGVGLSPTRSWSGGDPDGNTVYYTAEGHELGGGGPTY
jgi:hypothetical protein